MKCIIFAIHVLLFWNLGSAENRSFVDLLGMRAKTQIAETVDKLDKLVDLSNLLNDCVEPPLVCPNVNVTLWLYTRSNSDSPVKLSDVQRKNFELPDTSLTHPWKLIIHGYTKSKDEIPNPELRKEYFKKGRYNLISVDYAPLARDKCYLASVHNVPLIAKCTAEEIERFFTEEHISFKSLHVIGFSLGAQIAGQLYKYLSNDNKPARVTGLDPASPLFDGEVNDKISTKAGDFVDIIHTNSLGKGKLENLGHVDFYINGGISQPGCSKTDNTSTSTCNHDRAPKYFAESISSDKGFWGIPCDATNYFTIGCSADEEESVPMGEYTPFSARGIYYLHTTDVPPFALGKTWEKNSRRRLSTGAFS